MLFVLFIVEYFYSVKQRNVKYGKYMFCDLQNTVTHVGYICKNTGKQ